MTDPLTAATRHFLAARAAGFRPILLRDSEDRPDVLLMVRESGEWFDVVAVHSAADCEGRRVRSGDLDAGAPLGLPSVTPGWRRHGTPRRRGHRAAGTALNPRPARRAPIPPGRADPTW